MPEDGGSRSNFLKDAVTRVYEEKMSALRIPERSHSRNVSSSSNTLAAARGAENKASERQRRLGHAADVRALLQSPEIRQLPVSEERPISNWAPVLRKLDSPGPLSVPALPQPGAEVPLSPGKQVDDPVDKAVCRLVGMGFPADMAKKALAETDTGENLNVQAAIALCISWKGRKDHGPLKGVEGLGLRV